MLEPDPPVPIRLAVSPSGLGRVSCVPNADRVERFGLFHERPERLDRKAPRLHALNSSLGATIPRPIYPAGLRSDLRYPRRTSSRITATVTITTTPRIKLTGGPERAGLVSPASDGVTACSVLVAPSTESPGSGGSGLATSNSKGMVPTARARGTSPNSAIATVMLSSLPRS